MTMHYHGNEGGAVRLQLTDRAPLVRLTTRDGDRFYLAANEIVAVYPFVVVLAPGNNCLGSKVSLKGSDPDTFWVCTEEPETVFNRASSAQRRA